VFFGNLRLEQLFKNTFNVHEAPGAMKYVLVVLSVFCLFFVFSLSPLHYESAWILKGLTQLNQIPRNEVYHLVIPAIVNFIALMHIFMAYTLYVKRKETFEYYQSAISRFSQKQWFINEFYQAVFVRSIAGLSTITYRFDRGVVDGFVNLLSKTGIVLSAIIHWIDQYIVDGVVNGAASFAKTIGNFTRNFQTGRLQHYLLSMVLVVLTFFIIKIFFQAI
jgi:NADH-quinone oxidoreductase subunit L